MITNADSYRLACLDIIVHLNWTGGAPARSPALEQVWSRLTLLPRGTEGGWGCCAGRHSHRSRTLIGNRSGA
jgi:hypothetical protein